MASNGPYYQDPSSQDHQHLTTDFDLSQSVLEYGGVAAQPSTYPEPSHSGHEHQYNHQAGEIDATERAQLHDLVEAATSAAAQEQFRQQTQQFGPPNYQIGERATPTSAGIGSRRKHQVVDAQIQRTTIEEQGRTKRQKRTHAAPDSLNSVQEDVLDGQRSQRVDSDPAHLIDARAAGVHSAAALFRPPSDLSKKYTRPPMSKLFTSLQLDPEQFLKLQSSAKKYMLDPEHPDRQACVGNRGKSDTGQTRLDLQKCTRSFLELGPGQEHFGADAEPPSEVQGQRDFVWPRDKEKIVLLCTPLLRRMVTNERQRQYALEARKGGKPEMDGSGTDEAIAKPIAEESLLSNHYDPQLQHGPTLQIYLLDAKGRESIRKRIDLPLTDGVEWDFIADVIHRQALEALKGQAQIGLQNVQFYAQVLTSEGLVRVSADDEWRIALQDALQTVWLDNVVKIVASCR